MKEQGEIAERKPEETILEGQPQPTQPQTALKPGWLLRQFKKAEEDIRKWPAWMRKASGFD